MLPDLRSAYNQSFTKAIFNDFLKEVNGLHPGSIPFRLAETPIFIPKDLTAKMIGTCESIIDLILDPGFTELTDRSIPPAEKTPGKYSNPQTLIFDFGICKNDNAEIEPQLVEMQGFPSLFAFQVFYPEIIPRYFPVPDNFTQYLGRFDRASYVNMLKEVIVGEHDPAEVILLDIKPDQQKTRIDFYCTQDLIGVKPVCLTELIQEGNQLYYQLNGKKTRVKRIYNRMVADELNIRKEELGPFIDLTQPLDVEWIPHPDWFYRISKFTLPFIRHPYVPPTFFLNEIKQLPENLDQYVLKPLFSFAGNGVVIHVTPEDISAIEDPANWILQKKVNYAGIIATPGEPAKAEVRIMYLWKEGKARPEPAINLARLSKGDMIGVNYNKDKEWVGGSVAFFEH